MRCKACDIELTDSEAVKKDKQGDYEDMCGSCLRQVLLPELYQQEEEEEELVFMRYLKDDEE